MPKINLADVKGLDPIPNGWYDAEVVHAEEGTSQAGNEKIDLRWKVLAGEFEGRLIFDNLVFTESTLWRVKQTLIALGFDADFKGSVDGEELLGRHAEILVSTQVGSVDEESGEKYPDRNRVNRSRPSSLDVEDLL
jgi:hypothetical protein